MPIVIGIFFLLPLFFGALAEYLCCRLPRRRFWRFLPPVIAVVFLIVALWVRIQNWESKDVPPHPVNYFPGVPAVAAAWDVFGVEVLEVSLVAEDY